MNVLKKQYYLYYYFNKILETIKLKLGGTTSAFYFLILRHNKLNINFTLIIYECIIYDMAKT